MSEESDVTFKVFCYKHEDEEIRMVLINEVRLLFLDEIHLGVLMRDHVHSSQRRKLIDLINHNGVDVDYDQLVELLYCHPSASTFVWDKLNIQDKVTLSIMNTYLISRLTEEELMSSHFDIILDNVRGIDSSVILPRSIMERVVDKYPYTLSNFDIIALDDLDFFDKLDVNHETIRKLIGIVFNGDDDRRLIKYHNLRHLIVTKYPKFLKHITYSDEKNSLALMLRFYSVGPLSNYDSIVLDIISDAWDYRYNFKYKDPRNFKTVDINEILKLN